MEPSHDVVKKDLKTVLPCMLEIPRVKWSTTRPEMNVCEWDMNTDMAFQGRDSGVMLVCDRHRAESGCMPSCTASQPAKAQLAWHRIDLKNHALSTTIYKTSSRQHLWKRRCSICLGSIRTNVTEIAMPVAIPGICTALTSDLRIPARLTTNTGR